MPQAIRTPSAEQDLRDIAYYIAVKDGRPLTADRVVDGIIAKCEEYAGKPNLGTAAPDLGKGFRLFRFKRWVIIYRAIDDGIEILRIVDGARDYPSLFR